ncbi:MAG TPA: sodium ion-translocating decarboxylase subunit beta [Fibrobacteria bacterium]|nr:sodium ion-translocating decarboxylase subunit beta [Fibrobacteria bacterium]
MNLGELFAAIPGMFQGVVTLFQGNPSVAIARVFLIFLGFLLVYLGRKGTLEPLLMIPMGLAMSTVNAGVMLLDPMTTSAVMDYANSPMIRQAHSAVAPMATTADSLRIQGTLHVAPLVQQSENLLYILQVDWLQPIYTFTFSNGLIACFVFMGIGCLLDVGYLIARPFQSMILALFAELGTVLVFPIGVAFGLNPGEAAAIAMVGGADGPMVLFTSLMLAKDIFVPICVVAYLYLGLTYGGYPYLVRFLIPKKLLAIPMAPNPKARKITSGQKLAFAVVASTVLSLLFPVAAPLILSLFLGVAIRESGLDAFRNVVENVFLYGSTLFLGLILGILCEANTILNPKVLLLLVLGILALLLSGIGGILGGYFMYFVSGRKVNPAIGIAAVSCVPTNAKVAQKEVNKAAPGVIILPDALGANISGVITSAIFAAIYVSLIPKLFPVVAAIVP